MVHYGGWKTIDHPKFITNLIGGDLALRALDFGFHFESLSMFVDGQFIRDPPLANTHGGPGVALAEYGNRYTFQGQFL